MRRLAASMLHMAKYHGEGMKQAWDSVRVHPVVVEMANPSMFALFTFSFPLLAGSPSDALLRRCAQC